MSANNLGSKEKFGYGMIDCENALQNYNEFEKYYSDKKTVVENVDNNLENTIIDYNDADIICTEEESVRGYWSGDNHEAATSSKLRTIKRGSVWPDKRELKIEGMTSNPTGLPGGGFDSFTELKTVIISDTVTYIGNGVFADCMQLKKIQFSKNITKIGDYAFENCRTLTSIQIPDKVVTIGSCAFSGAENLKEINISNSVKKIGAGAFVDCINLKKSNFRTALRE